MTPLYGGRCRAEFCTPGATDSLLKFLRKVFTFNKLLTQHGSAQSAIKSDEVIPLTRASNPTGAIRFVMQLRGMKLLAALSRRYSLAESGNRCAAGSRQSEPTLEARTDRNVKLSASSTHQEPSIDSKSMLLKDIRGTVGGTPLAPRRVRTTDAEASPKHKRWRFYKFASVSHRKPTVDDTRRRSSVAEG